MADSLVLFYYWNLFGLWLALHWLLKHYFTAVFPLLLLEFWLVYDWFDWAGFQVLLFSCFMHGLTKVLFLFYYISSIFRGNPVILQGWVLNWSNLWFFKFRLFLSFSRNIKPIKLKSCRNLYHKGDNLGNIVSVMHDYS